MIFTTVTIANAQTSDWNNAVKQFVEETRNKSQELTENFRQMGIDATMSAEYNALARELVMEVMFQPQIWNMFNNQAVQAGKAENVRSYQVSYKTNPDFRHFIDLMKQANAKFRVKYSCKEGGTVKSKDFTITPSEIIN